MEVKLLKLARAEFDDAIAYYELEQTGLGELFRREVFRSISRITEFPSAYQKFSEGTRRCLIAKFPYAIIYHSIPDRSEILVVAISHLHRHPDYWTVRET